MYQPLTLDDLHTIRNAKDVAMIFAKLGYDAAAQPLDVEELELPARSAEAILAVYLLTDYQQGSDSYQILLFELQPEEFSSFSLARNRMKRIASSLCQRSAKYLLIATKDYRQLLLVSPQMKLDEKFNLVITAESCLLDLKEPSYQNRNWLEKLTFQSEAPRQLVEQQRRSIQGISAIQQASAESFTEDLVRMYLREIGRIPMLQAHEEIELGRQVAKLVELERVREQLRNELQREPSNQEWAAATLIPLSAYPVGRRAKDRLVAANLRLVVSVAKKYQNRGLDLLDLIQEGSLGLVRAAEKFDPERGYKFSTYATWWIRQGCTRAIAYQSRLIRIPVHLYEKASHLKRTARELSQQLGHCPTPAEVAGAMQTEPAQIKQIVQAFQTPVSLDLTVGNEGDTALQDLIEADNEFEEMLISESIRENIALSFDALKPKEVDVIKLRYGWYESNEQTLQAIGDLFGVSRERIRQIERRALEKLGRSKYVRDLRRNYFAC